MAVYTVTVTAGTCSHVKFTIKRDGTSWKTFDAHLGAMKEDIDVQDLLFAELKLLQLQNPTLTKAQLKALVESKEWTI